MSRLSAALLFCLWALSACVAPPETHRAVAAEEVAALAAAIRDLGPDIDPGEAERAAALAFAHTRTLAAAYRITDPPLIHNTKVNLGLRPRGLCWHWAEDIERRLDAENFRTLEMHRAIANADNPFRIDHSTAIIGRRGDALFEGLVLDPWRLGGRLFWGPVTGDPDYVWHPRAEVLRRIYPDLAAPAPALLPSGAGTAR